MNYPFPRFTFHNIGCALLLSLFSSYCFSQPLELVGIGTYSEFGKTNMVIRLDAIPQPAEARELDQSGIANRLSFRMTEAKTERRWSQFWSQNLSLNNSVDAIRDNFDALLIMTGAVKGTLESGDLIEFEETLSGTFRLKVNDVELALIEQPGFYNFLLTALVGNIPPSSSLKQQLLGEDLIDQNLAITFFDSMQFSNARAIAVSGWQLPAPEPEPEPEPEPVPEPAAVAIAEPAPEPLDTSAQAAAVIPQVETASIDTIEEPEPTAPEAVLEENESTAASVAQTDAELTPEPPVPPENTALDEEEQRELTLDMILANQLHMQSVLRKVYSNISYPRSAVRQNREGMARIELTINRDGSLAEATLINDSGYNDLNKAALKSVTDSEPFDPIPEMNPNDQTVVQLPIRFALN